MGHLLANGFEVETVDVDDLTPVKARYEIRPQHQGCHTATVEGYVIEGHVPAWDIKRLLEEEPDVRLLTVPGMPRGSPGMEVTGGHSESYDVLAVDASGRETVFATY